LLDEVLPECGEGLGVVFVGGEDGDEFGAQADEFLFGEVDEFGLHGGLVLVWGDFTVAGISWKPLGEFYR